MTISDVPQPDDKTNLNKTNIAAQASRLVDAFGGVSKSVSDLSERVDEHQRLIMKTMQSHRVVISTLAVGLALVLGVLVLGAFLLKQQNDNTRHINDLQNRTSLEVLCPLYGVFINSINANPTPSNLTPEQAEFRKKAALTIQKGYQDLGCTPA